MLRLHSTPPPTVFLPSGDSNGATTLIAGRNLTLTGSSAVSRRPTLLTAGGDIAIQAAEERHEKKEKQSGVFSSGGAGFTIGRRSLA